MKYHYKVIESESSHYPKGMEFLSEEKMHDDRTKEKTGEYSDKACKSWKIKLVHRCNGHPSITERLYL